MTKATIKVLIVEDNSSLASNIASYFSDKSVDLDFAYDGQHGLERALEDYFDCVVLDINLPKCDGFTVCKLLRERAGRHIPVIMLTARDALHDKLDGFASGADDYLTKPFALEELWVRCLALAKRHLLNASHTLKLGEGEKAISLNAQTQTVTRNERLLTLPPIGFKILQCLIEAHPRAITKSELISRIWGDEECDPETLRSHLYQLRKAIDKPFSQPIIKTIHGIGLALDL
ncbi:Two-component system regulatory protein [Pseudoalteromonas luteoviolacea B = ATCC 29581]|nr:Two-component system regulatory protein [Pseudoalteromonas luteoviolacea B = ATCC 29581]